MKYVTEIEGQQIDIECLYNLYYRLKSDLEEKKYQELKFKAKIEVEVV